MTRPKLEPEGRRATEGRVRGWAVQPRVSGGLHRMSGWVCDGHTGWHGGGLLHCLFGGPGESQLDSGVCGM